MIRIAHFGDIHIHNLQRHEEYRIQFDKIYNKLKEQKPDRILIAGDLFEKFVEISNEAKTLAGDFLHELANIAKIIIVPGNHDFMKKNKNRINSVFTLVNLIKNPNITYFGNSGFFDDDNIVWVNYSHLEKNIDPWIDIKHTKTKSKIYIAIFHDPINDSSTDMKQVFNSTKYKSISDFKNDDFVMMADIHKHQYFRKNKSACYCGSTIQQNFGENPTIHGYELWDIDDRNNFTSEHIEIPNDHNYINFEVGKINYDDLNLTHPLLNIKSEVKVHWCDLSANINFENEVKIREYFKNNYNLLGIKISKNPIYTDVSGVEMVTESIDVLNPDIQRKIFIEYLETNGYKEEFIEEVLSIDDLILDRLQLDKTNNGIYWTIDKIWFDNFKSYGDNNEINFKEMDNNIIIQLKGENQQGKTSILDAISYILYGKTTTTIKREKNGDNRYINKMRDMDYVQGGAVITINNETYTLVRRTDRKWNRYGTEITSCITTLDYYKGIILTEEFKLTGEVKDKTQEFINLSIGDFNDFIRIAVTNADNLNDILSMDRSVFIDSIIRDAGYHIFELKLEEFKEYRKVIVKTDIKIDLDESKQEIEDKNLEKEGINDRLGMINHFIEYMEESKPMMQGEKDRLLSSMDKIDERISTLNLDEVNEKITTEKEKITTRKEQLNKIDELKLEILSYDPDDIKNKRTEFNKIKDIISENNSKVSKFTNTLTEIKSKINTLNMDIKNIVDGHIRLIEDESKENDVKLSNIKDEFSNKVIEYSIVLKHDLHDIILKKESYKRDIDNLMEDGRKLKATNEELETSRICITCERALDAPDLLVINKKIEQNKAEMGNIIARIKSIKPKHDELSESIDKLNNKLDKLSKKEYDFDETLNKSYLNYIDKKNNTAEVNAEIERRVKLIKNGNIPSELQTKLKASNEEKRVQNDKITEIEDEKKILEKAIESKKEELETLKTEIEELEKEEGRIQKKKDAIHLEEKVKADIERCNNLVIQYEKDITEYNNELDKIENNKKVKVEIDNMNKNIAELEDNIKEKVNEKSKVESSIAVLDSEIQKLTKDILIFEKQKARDEILDTYMKCVHRDGLPTYLLKKSIHIINQELTNILTDVDYNLFFDEELNLKLAHDIKIEASQNAIESSGMERTFSAIALKMALRKINNKSKPNFIMLDEIMLKLLNASVDKFIVLLDNIKTQVDKLVIIEHIHPINYDVLIEVTKDEQGVSSLKIED